MKWTSMLTGVAFCAALPLAAQAADLSEPYIAPAPVPYVEAFTWTGLYGGVNIGYAFGGSDNVGIHQNPGGYDGRYGKLGMSGIFGGGQVGGNMQFGNFVFGLEADIQAADIDDKASGSNAFRSTAAKSSVDWYGTLRPRLGVAFDRTLVYATGGLAFGGVDYRAATINAAGDYASFKKGTTRTGYTVGGGVEYALDSAWSVKAEYQYVNFGKYNVSGSEYDAGGASTGRTLSTKATPDFHSVRLGFNYRF